MSFSLRSMFNKSEPQNVGALHAAPPLNAAPTHINSPQQPPTAMTPSGFPPAPPPFGGPLFRTLGNDDSNSEPLAFDPGQSPFSSPSASANVALTVADVLPQIPQEMARATAIPQDQPVQISPQILSHALSSGQLAVPLFEVYRVCPGIFQTPVSPDDTRMVRLPAAKLPALISGAMPAAAQPEAAPASPFSSLFSAAPSTPSAAPSPFQSLIQPEPPSPPPTFSIAEPAPSSPLASTILPPRRDPSQPPASSLPPTPFLDLAASAPAPASPPPSPFGVMPAPSSPFSVPSAPPAIPSLFSSAPESPFASSPAAPEPATSAPPSPFAAFSAPPEPEKEAAPSLLQSIPSAAPFPAPSAPGPGKLTGAATASVAALLQGQSADALGFDPGMVPSWISAQFNGGIIAELQEMPAPSLDLGTIVDAITDIGFRNVLNSARRGHQIDVSLSHFSPAASTTMKPAAAAASPAAAATPTMVTPMRVTPAAPPSESAAPSPFAVPAEAPQTLANPFTVAPAEPSPKAEPLNPFAAAPEPLPAAANPFSLPAESPPTSPSPFGAAPLFTAPPQPESPPPAAPVFKVEPGNPFANVPEAPAPAATFITPTPPPEPAALPPALFTEAAPPAAAPTPIQPKVDISSLFAAEAAPAPTPAAAPTESPTQPPASPLPASFSFGAKAFDPFAPTDSTPSVGGFSSFDLLGGAPTTPEPIAQSEPAPAPVVEEPKTLPTQTVAQPEPAPTPEPEPVAPPKTPRFIIDPEPEVESETAIVPEIPVVLEQPEPEPFVAKKTTSWPDIDPIPTPKPEPIQAPLFVDRTPPVSKAPALDFSPPEKTPLSSAMPTLAPAPRGIAPAKSSLGLSAMNSSGEEQLLLRALLDSDEDLSLERVIEMSSNLPGISACALVRGNEVIAGSSTKGSDAKAFLAQAAEVAKSLRTLAPLIGISDAETFTLNTDSRLITLCFPGEVTLALLHDREPTLGLRDKLTLIARQLDSMVSKR